MYEITIPSEESELFFKYFDQESNNEENIIALIYLLCEYKRNNDKLLINISRKI